MGVLETQRSSGPGRTIVLAVVGAGALALVAALTLGGGSEPRDSSGGETGPVSVYGDYLPDFAGSPNDPALGLVGPSFDATTFEGIAIEVRPGQGSGYVIGFFAHWCPHCQAEMPKLVDWMTRRAVPEGVTVLAVSTAVYPERGNLPRNWFDTEGWPQLAVRDDESSAVGEAYGLRSFPYFVVLGTDGRVRGRIGGGLTPEQWDWMLDQARRSGIVASSPGTA